VAKLNLPESVCINSFPMICLIDNAKSKKVAYFNHLDGKESLGVLRLAKMKG
jgi:hypothetical protein